MSQHTKPIVLVVGTLAAIQEHLAHYIAQPMPEEPSANAAFHMDAVNGVIGMVDNPAILKAMTDASFDYEADAVRTKSPNFYGEKVPYAALLNALQALIEVGNELDKIKKSLFYGRDFTHSLTELQAGDLSLSAAQMKAVPMYIGNGDSQRGADIVHAILGCITESAEMAEALFNSLTRYEPFDMENFAEEIGDNRWYHAIAAVATGIPLDKIDRGNIAKLRKRFPEKFTEVGANVRNTEAEMQAMTAVTGQRNFIGNGCPCEPSGSDGLTCPDANGRPLCAGETLSEPCRDDGSSREGCTVRVPGVGEIK